ncbi:hypothetical protein J1614_006642 [Plenodomus biglobosus]|nr:hypothetical protein J1614_006642 [Plenodomus biglobosus]
MGISSLQIGLLVAGCAGIAITGIILFWNMYPDLNCLPFSQRSRPRREKTEDIALEAQHRLSATSVDGEMEKYGELYIPPNRNPLHIGLDIINRMLLATGLPMRAVNQDAFSKIEQGHTSRLTPRLPQLTSITSPGQLSKFFSANQAAVLRQFAADSDNPSLIAAVSRIQRDSLSLSPNLQEIGRNESANYIRDGPWIAVTHEELAMGIEQAQRPHEIFTIGDGEDYADEAEDVMPDSQTNFGTGKGMAQLYIQSNVTGQ